MTSIAFTSFFLGLVLGAQNIGVDVEGPVVAVEYQLDGKSIGRAPARPWSIRVDLGTAISPHVLVARALDRKGEEVARVRQWLNLPRPRAETEIVLEKDANGRATAARLSWQSLFGSRPTSVAVTFDGRPLTVDGAGRVALPPWDPGRTHLLTVQLEFTEHARSRTDVVVGGDTGDEAKSELTAIPVTVRGRGPMPELADLQDCFEEAGRPLRVVAVENGPAQVVLVRESGNREARDVLAGGNRYFLQGDSERMFGDIRLSGDDRVRFIWPAPQRFTDPVLSSDLFPKTEDMTMATGSLHWLLTRAYMPQAGSAEPRFTDAAAVAGLEAFGSSTRRAVVVVLGSAKDSSRLPVEAVRSYLDDLRVPLFVWSLVDPRSRPELGRWGNVLDVSNPNRLREAVRILKKNLKDQRILWFDGKHLPQAISLTGRGATLFDASGPGG
jgi:hypothetical protein